MRERGFSLIEMLVVVATFTVITGAAFLLLNVSQQRYKMESELLDSFQSARIALDQMMRDIHTSGFPPRQSMPAAVTTANPQMAAFPFAWLIGDGYPNAPCTVPGCRTPGAYDMIVETDLDPENGNGIEWIRYRLSPNDSTVLERGVVNKAAAGTNDADAATAAVMFPYVENVMNDAPDARKTAIRGSHPAMFPGNASVPIFNYLCGAPPVPCNGVTDTVMDIREVSIVLIVAAPNLDPRTRQVRVVTLTGLARRINPS
jgi:prepilin-type N-terminal cleavage/methylation domain-containing protein